MSPMMPPTMLCFRTNDPRLNTYECPKRLSILSRNSRRTSKQIAGVVRSERAEGVIEVAVAVGAVGAEAGEASK